MPKVTLRPSLEVIDIPEEKNLLTALRDAGIYVKSSCGGHATCSDCIIKIVSGEDSLTPPPFEELKLLGNVFHITKERLSCQTKITGDVTIDLSNHDKSRDQERMRSKTSQFSKSRTVRRTKDEQKEQQAFKDSEQQTATEERPAKQSGFKRPKRKY
jgi:ferredoxin